MSIRTGLLALLAEDCAYGNQLRLAFEQRTGGIWPLNIGQVYQSLDRLVRDGLAVVEEPGPDQVPAQARAHYRITGEGLAQVRAWFTQPVPRTSAPRDELAIKLAIALCSPEADVVALIDAQRTASMGALQAATAVKRRALAADPRAAHQPWLLVLDRLLFDIEAELRWLDLCESALLVPMPRSSRGAEPADPVPPTLEESR